MKKLSDSSCIISLSRYNMYMKFEDKRKETTVKDTLNIKELIKEIRKHKTVKTTMNSLNDGYYVTIQKKDTIEELQYRQSLNKDFNDDFSVSESNDGQTLFINQEGKK